jgi:hypothetical protein
LNVLSNNVPLATLAKRKQKGASKQTILHVCRLFVYGGGCISFSQLVVMKRKAGRFEQNSASKQADR